MFHDSNDDYDANFRNYNIDADIYLSEEVNCDMNVIMMLMIIVGDRNCCKGRRKRGGIH